MSQQSQLFPSDFVSPIGAESTSQDAMFQDTLSRGQSDVMSAIHTLPDQIIIVKVFDSFPIKIRRAIGRSANETWRQRSSLDYGRDYYDLLLGQQLHVTYFLSSLFKKIQDV